MAAAAGGTILNNGGGNAVLTIGCNGGGNTFAGLIADNTAGSGTVGLIKTGGGTEILSAANSYSGGTTMARARYN